jgi:hypothetical protein
MRKATPFYATIVAVALTAACDSFETPAGPDADASLNRAAAAAGKGQQWTTDHEFARVARADVPGFAGYYLQDDGTPVIRLKDQTQRGAAERYLASQLAAAAKVRRGRSAGVPVRPEFREARYDFAQLKEWADPLAALATSRSDVYTIDVDEVENRVRVGVADQGAIAAVRTEAARIGVPGDALFVETQPKPEQRVNVGDWNPTLQGGIQIASAAGYCTLGFNALRDGYWIFVTNSHCTNSYFAYDGGAVYQNTVTGPNLVGWEVADTGLWNCVGTALLCRRADAAYIYQSHTRGIAQGVVARTPWAFGGRGGLNIVGQYDIVARYAGGAPVGTWLDKTGRTSGSTYGQVTQSCVTIGNLVCQDVSNVWSEPGDSGSPMMVYTGGGPTGYGAHLYGILWGGPSNSYNVTYSSRLPGIEADLGPIYNVCIPGYGC